jgi:hypothetical protein
MARSLVLQEAQINGVTNPSTKSVMLMSQRILGLSQTLMTYNGTLINATSIKYMFGDGSKPDQIMVTQAASDIRASVNTANTSNNIDILALTRKNANGTTTAINVNVSDIVRAYASPDSTFDALVITENATRDQTENITADEMVQGIVTSLNS